jgi:hypothetical protein
MEVIILMIEIFDSGKSDFHTFYECNSSFQSNYRLTRKRVIYTLLGSGTHHFKAEID